MVHKSSNYRKNDADLYFFSAAQDVWYVNNSSHLPSNQLWQFEIPCELNGHTLTMNGGLSISTFNSTFAFPKQCQSAAIAALFDLIPEV